MKTGNRHGFTMIEVLVAATILIVIVMMMGALFQQTSMAWRTGVLRTGGYMQLRSYIGTLQRDASAMINANLIPKQLLCNSQEQRFDGTSLEFYTLTGTDESRALNFITYDLSGNRTQRTLKLNQGGAAGNAAWDSEDTSNLLKFMPNQTEENMSVKPQRFIPKVLSGVGFKEYDRDGNEVISARQKFPIYLSVDAEIGQVGQLYDVGAESAGPDKIFGTGPNDPQGKDDIRTFVLN